MRFVVALGILASRLHMAAVDGASRMMGTLEADEEVSRIAAALLLAIETRLPGFDLKDLSDDLVRSLKDVRSGRGPLDLSDTIALVRSCPSARRALERGLSRCDLGASPPVPETNDLAALPKLSGLRTDPIRRLTARRGLRHAGSTTGRRPGDVRGRRWS